MALMYWPVVLFVVLSVVGCALSFWAMWAWVPIEGCGA